MAIIEVAIKSNASSISCEALNIYERCLKTERNQMIMLLTDGMALTVFS